MKALIRFLRKIKLIPRDPFGNILFLKRILIAVLAVLTYGRINLANRIRISGTEHLKGLPRNNVLFVSNHQTYYTDVIAFYHIICSTYWGFKNTINYPLYILFPKANIYYVAAEETMKESGLIPKIFALAGAITVRRSWRAKGSDVQRGADLRAPLKIKAALDFGWVINFPQGTTSPYAPIRKGTSHIIKEYNPIVVPIVIDGFRRAFDKKGLFFKKRGVTLSVAFQPPMRFAEDVPIEEITKAITKAIGQERPPKSEEKPV